MGRRGRWLWVAAVALLATLLGGRWLAVGTVDRLWGEALGVGASHASIAEIRLLLLATAFVMAAVWCVGHLYLVYRSIGSIHLPRRVGDIEFVEAVPARYLLLITVLLGLLVAVLLSHRAAGWWEARALTAAAGDLGLRDPVLGRDVGYYLFQLPWERTVHSFVTIAAGVMLAATAVLYAALGAMRWSQRRFQIMDMARIHLAGLAAAFALALFWGYRLEPAEYVAGIHDVPVDAVLTDVRLPAARLLSSLALVAAGGSLLWMWSRRAAVLVVPWVVLVLTSFAGHYVVPAFAAAARSPDEVELAGLAGRREELVAMAYGTTLRGRVLRVPEPPNPRHLARYARALEAAPYWDRVAVNAILARLGGAGNLGRIHGASLAAYRVGWRGHVPVYLAVGEARAGSDGGNGGGALTREQTHAGAAAYGGGAIAVQAHRVSPQGLPLFVPALDRPDSAVADVTELRLARREVAFSPRAAGFVVTAGEGDGAVGVTAGGFWRRAALAWVLQTPRLLNAELVPDSSLLLWERGVSGRLERFAPFARFGTPYPVVARGRIYWLAPGYVSAEGFPLAPAVRWRDRRVRFLRSSLTGVVDAHSGTTAVYLAESPDPISAAWRALAPQILRSADEMPAELRAHVRYPDELFEVQVELLRGSWARGAEGARMRARPASPERAVTHATPFWWVGPALDDTVPRLRLMAAVEVGDPPLLLGVAVGSVQDGVPRFTVARLESPREVLRPADRVRRLDGSPGDTVRLTGAVRTVAFPDGILAIQSAYAGRVDGPEPPRLVTAAVAWDGVVAEGPTLGAALRRVQRAAPPPAAVAAEWLEARRWFERLDAARRAGDWVAFGEAYEQLRRLLVGSPDSTP